MKKKLFWTYDYENPEWIPYAVDNSGLKLWITDNPRKYDAGLFSTGVTISMLQMIPPMERKLFTSTGICSSQCTQAMFPPEGLKVFAWMPHTHLAGRKVRVR